MLEVGGMKLRKEPWEKIAWFHPYAIIQLLQPSLFNHKAWVIDRIYDWILGSRSNHVSWWAVQQNLEIQNEAVEYGQQWLQTCPLRRCHFKPNVVFQPTFFSGLVSFYWGSISQLFSEVYYQLAPRFNSPPILLDTGKKQLKPTKASRILIPPKKMEVDKLYWPNISYVLHFWYKNLVWLSIMLSTLPRMSIPCTRWPLVSKPTSFLNEILTPQKNPMFSFTSPKTNAWIPKIILL